MFLLLAAAVLAMSVSIPQAVAGPNPLCPPGQVCN
jgi:hypothetical protein